MFDASRKSIPIVVLQHVDDAIVLRAARSTLVRGADVKLHHLKRLDDRIAAHLDALAVAGDDAWRMCAASLESPSAAAVYVALIRALEDRRPDQIELVLALTETLEDTRRGAVSAFGWLERSSLQGIVSALLSSHEGFRRWLGLSACAVHRVDPGNRLRTSVRQSEASERARAARAIGELGLLELMSACTAVAQADAYECQLWGNWSAVLLGDRARALRMLADLAVLPGKHQDRAFTVALQALNMRDAQGVLHQYKSAGASLRALLTGSGLVGDPSFVPWLTGQMQADDTARPAGEAFSLITGADLALLDLERKPPENFEAGPNDNPDDDNVDMDPDEGLPWPDVAKVEAWWAANAARFQPGQRYFMGAPVTKEHCIHVLKTGYQRQRILAAQYLSLLEPGTPLFNTSAPAWRQQRQLARM